MRISRRTVDIFGFFFDPRVPVLFVVGTLVTAVIGNAAYELVLDLIGQKTKAKLVAIIIGGVLVIFFIVLALRALAAIFIRRTGARIGGSQAFSVPRKGIIFTVGKQSDTINLCLRHQKPEFVGFLCTEGSEQYANNLISTFHLDADHCTKQIADPWNINDVRKKSHELLFWMMQKHLSSTEIVFDITGGLTTMSVGMFMIAQENRIDSQYVKSDYDDKGKRLPGTEEAVFISSYRAVG
jgi:hypothetical protein